MTAREIHEKDKGGLLFSPVVGLHENVAELDFESMFPNIILRHNISYETVTPTHVDKTRQGFLGAVVKTVLDRRLYFKHLRKKFPKRSKGYRWCNQRQKALKRVLVCIYGFSGCFANRFNNVAAYNEINAVSRRILVQTVNICLSNGFKVLYGNTDSIFVKRLNATQENYEELARTIQRETGLPIALDKHYKFIVFMRQETHPNVEAMNRFFGKLTNGELNCRGIELRRRDCPVFLKEFQKRLIQTLFDANDWREIIESRVANAKAFVYDNYHRVLRGDIDPTKLAVSKRLRKDVDSYKSMFPHVVAAKHLAQKGKKLEEYVTVDFVFTNAKHSNPLRRVIPAIMLSEGCNYYDRRKYGRTILDVANTVLKTLEKDEPIPFTLDSFQK
jgi:DNA polymerase elongation subunit (family B)